MNKAHLEALRQARAEDIQSEVEKTEGAVEVRNFDSLKSDVSAFPSHVMSTVHHHAAEATNRALDEKLEKASNSKHNAKKTTMILHKIPKTNSRWATDSSKTKETNDGAVVSKGNQSKDNQGETVDPKPQTYGLAAIVANRYARLHHRAPLCC